LSGAFGTSTFTVPTSGVWELSYYYYITTAEQMHAYFSYGTGYVATNAYAYDCNANPTTVVGRVSYNSNQIQILVNWQGYLASGTILGIGTYTGGGACYPIDTTRSYFSVALLNSAGTMFQTNPTGTMLTTPTPTPTSNPVAAIEWNVPTPYSPTPAPSSLVTWSNSNTRATISSNGIVSRFTKRFFSKTNIFYSGQSHVGHLLVVLVQIQLSSQLMVEHGMITIH